MEKDREHKRRRRRRPVVKERAPKDVTSPRLFFVSRMQAYLITSGIIKRDRRNATISAVQKFFTAINIETNPRLNSKFAEMISREETLSKFWYACIQRTDKKLLHNSFAILEAQSVRTMLSHFCKFLQVLEAHGFLRRTRRKFICQRLRDWRRHLSNFASQPKDSGLVDLERLALKPKYKNALELLKDTPWNITNKSEAIRCRDALAGKIASRWAMRACELASVSRKGIVEPELSEGWYVLPAGRHSKTTYKYGEYAVTVPPDIFELVKSYDTYVRPILAIGCKAVHRNNGAEVSKDEILFLGRDGLAISDKGMCDVYKRALKSGFSDLTVNTRNLRHSLATKAEVWKINGLNRRKSKWKLVPEVLSRFMRHSASVHSQTYTKISHKLLGTRGHKFVDQLTSKSQPEDSYIEPLTDGALAAAVLPNHSEAAVEGARPEPATNILKFPKERTSTDVYSLLSQLYDDNFTAQSDVTTKHVRHLLQLPKNEECANALKKALDIKSLKNLQKILSRLQTFKKFRQKDTNAHQ